MMSAVPINQEMVDLIRREKLDLVLPEVMRDNNVDMWIHVIQEGSNDVLREDLATDRDNAGIYVFADRGGGRIECKVFRGRSRGNWDTPTDIFDSERELRQYVAKCNPRRIAVNFSEELSRFNTISHTDYLKLMKALGNEYAKRVIPADHLTIDYCSRKVMSEIVLYGQLCMISAEIIERAFDTIEPGVTTLRDVALWLRDNKIAVEYGCDAPRSLGNVFVRDPDGNESLSDDHVIQGGDLVGIVHGVTFMNYETHISGVAYVLREEETGLPPEVKKIFDHALQCREIFRRNIKVGLTAGETLEILTRKLEEAGYVCIDEQEYDRDADPKKTQVHMDLHALGRGILAPRISPLGPDRARNIKISPYHTFALEYMVFMPVPEWGKGKHLYICLHDGVIVTDRGVEFPYPPLNEIHIIR